MRQTTVLTLFLLLFSLFSGFSADNGFFTRDTRIEDVINDPAFEDYGRLLFPLSTWYYSGDTLAELRLTWYNNIDPDTTVEIVNYLKKEVLKGNKVFYDIYTETEMAADPAKRDTGLFFFRGEEGAPFAICNAGGGFVYVGAMQDSFPHALEISKRGYNAFALIYRPGADTALEDLARGQSASSSHILKSWAWIRRDILSGVDPQEAGWLHGWDPTVLRLSAVMIFPVLMLSSCSTRDIQITPLMILRPSHAWGRGTV